MKGDSRKEMRAIRDLVPKGDLKGIAAELRAMERLWKGKDQRGLLKRREAEAELVENAKATDATTPTSDPTQKNTIKEVGSPSVPEGLVA